MRTKFLAFAALALASVVSASAQQVPAGALSGFWSGGVSAPTTFNPASASSGVSLSNGNLTASTTGGGSPIGVLTLRSNNAGLHYFEEKWTAISSSDASSNVIVNSTQYGNCGINGTGCAATFKSGNIFIGGSSVCTACAPIAASTTIGIAVDFTHLKIWFTADGTHWNSTSSATNSPISNVGGLSISGLTLPLFAGVTFLSASDGPVTANFGATAYTYASTFSALQAAGYTNW